MKAQKLHIKCYHVNFPFGAYSYPHSIKMVKGFYMSSSHTHQHAVFSTYQLLQSGRLSIMLPNGGSDLPDLSLSMTVASRELWDSRAAI